MQKKSSKSSVVNFTLDLYSQNDTSRHESSTLIFIVQTGLTQDTCSPRLISAKKLCEDFNLHSQWLTEKDLLKITPQSNNVYVLDPFNGKAYDYLEEHLQKSKNFMIIGPQCIKYGVQRQEPNTPIQSKGYPFCSVAMQNICITFTGFQKEQGAELTDLVQKMNGVVSKAYSVATTHVVAANTLTEKCREAYKNDVLVMTEDWIRVVWAECQDELIVASDPKFVKYNCPIFHNVRICVSQIASDTKKSLQKIITENGGSYSKEFRRYKTDVLIIPFASGEKYKYAKQWEVSCATPEWIQQSKQAGHLLPFEDFKPSVSSMLSSTPIHSDRPNIVPELTAFSMIAEETQGGKMDTINATYLTEASHSTTVRRSNVKQQQQQQMVLDDTLEVLQKAPAGFLDSCTIYLCEHNSSDEKIYKIKKILNSFGAVRSDKITEKVSHVLVINGKISEQEIQAIRSIGYDPHIVSIEWLLQSAKQTSPANEQLYAFEIPSLKEDRMKRNEKINPPQSNIKITTLGINLNGSGHGFRTELEVENIVKENKTPPLSNIKMITPSSSLCASSAPKMLRQQDNISNARRLDFESDIETPPPKQPLRMEPPSDLPNHSPLLRPGMSLEGSRQLKRALALACEPSTVYNIERRKSTPFREVMRSFWDAKEAKVKQLMDMMNRAQEVANEIQSHPDNEEETGSVETIETYSPQNSTTDNQLCPRVFILSGCGGTERATTRDLIDELGGIVSAVDFYDKTANAVIAYKVTKSEKILGAIAAGQPILHPNYLKVCQEANRLVEFGDYIWKEEDGTTEAERNMARVARYWYLKMQVDPTDMPFKRFRVWLVESKQNKREAYKRLIEAGGGKICSNLDNVNVVIGDGYEAVTKGAQAKIPVKVPMFLNDVIISFADVSWLH